MNRLLFICLSCLLITAACGRKKVEQKDTNAGVPQAFQERGDELYSISKKSRSDLVDRLYQEALEKRADLREVERMMKELFESSADSTAAFSKFRQRNQEFYIAARRHSKELGDSILAARLTALLGSSEQVFQKGIDSLSTADSLVTTLKTQLEDFYEILKVEVATEMMEDYQQNFRPATAPILGLIDSMRSAKARLDSMISDIRPLPPVPDSIQ